MKRDVDIGRRCAGVVGTAFVPNHQALLRVTVAHERLRGHPFVWKTRAKDGTIGEIDIVCLHIGRIAALAHVTSEEPQRPEAEKDREGQGCPGQVLADFLPLVVGPV